MNWWLRTNIKKNLLLGSTRNSLKFFAENKLAINWMSLHMVTSRLMANAEKVSEINKNKWVISYSLLSINSPIDRYKRRYKNSIRFDVAAYFCIFNPIQYFWLRLNVDYSCDLEYKSTNVPWTILCKLW